MLKVIPNNKKNKGMNVVVSLLKFNNEKPYFKYRLR